MKLPHGDYHPKTDGLNVAESSGSVQRGSIDEQRAYLSKALNAYQDFDARWKVVTIFMTANDVCGECDGPVSDAFVANWKNRTG